MRRPPAPTTGVRASRRRRAARLAPHDRRARRLARVAAGRCATASRAPDLIEGRQDLRLVVTGEAVGVRLGVGATRVVGREVWPGLEALLRLGVRAATSAPGRRDWKACRCGGRSSKRLQGYGSAQSELSASLAGCGL